MTRDPLLDEAIAAVRDEPLDSATLDAALARVERRLTAAVAGAVRSGHAAEPPRIQGCEGFQELLPALAAGALSPERRLLLEDHLRECVPCRRARQAAGRVAAAPAVASGRARTGTFGASARGWRLAAALGGLVLGAGALWMATGGRGPSASAEVRVIEGELLAVESTTARPLAAGAAIGPGDTVRTGAGSRAVFALADGSRVELAPRSQVRLTSRRDGVVVELGRGNVIVEAAEQRRGHLYVRTDDCLVSVVGTIFTVANGTRGSRVSVLDGEVRVRHGAEQAVLHPGDQVSTSDRLERVALTDEIAWSRNAEAYRDRIAALTEIGRQLDRALEVGADRTSTRLLDLAPAGTTIYAGLPDVSGQLADAIAELEQRAQENPALAEWWGEAGEEAVAVAGRLREFGDYLGDELVIAVAPDARESLPVMLAEIHDERGLRAAITAELDRHAESDGAPAAVLVDDPARVDAPANTLLLWPAPAGVLVATPSLDHLRAVAATLDGAPSAFVGSSFHRRLADVYRHGAGWLLAFDAGRLLASRPTADDARAAQQLAASGFASLEHVVLESYSDGGATENRAVAGFAGPRTGLASWLAAPGPSGALEFVSPQAAMAVAGLLKDPVAMFDDLLRLVQLDGDDAVAGLERAEDELGLSLRDDLAAALGGDVAFALDGPWLPRPSWKLVVEVADLGLVVAGLDRVTEARNRQAARHGEAPLVWREEVAAGRVYRTLARTGGADLVHLTFSDGYLLAGPSRALLAESIDRRAAGATLASSAAFRDALPTGDEPDFSAIAWQNLAASAGDLGRLLADAAGVPAAERDQLVRLAGDVGPMLAVAVADGDRVSFASRGGRGPLGLPLGSLFALAGLADPAEFGPQDDFTSDPDAAAETAAATVETEVRSAA